MRAHAEKVAAAAQQMEGQRRQAAANCRAAEAELDGVQSLNDTLFKYVTPPRSLLAVDLAAHSHRRTPMRS